MITLNIYNINNLLLCISTILEDLYLVNLFFKDIFINNIIFILNYKSLILSLLSLICICIIMTIDPSSLYIFSGKYRPGIKKIAGE